MSFLGGGSDFPEHFAEYGGAVLGTAIDKYIYHTFSKFPSWLFDHSIRFSYRKVEHVKSLDELEHVPFREILRAYGISSDIEVNLASDLPSFSGLGSSSAFTVGMIKGLLAQSGKFISQRQLAEAAIHMEREVLKESVGYQDQIFAAYGGFNTIRFSGKNEFDVERLALPEETQDRLTQSLVMIYTGKKRRADSIEKQKLERLSLISGYLREIQQLVDAGLSCLLNGKDLDQIGILLHENWKLKKSLASSVSDPYIDSIYDRGIACGALGGKVLGAGGGGFLLFYVPKPKRKSFLEKFSKVNEVKFKLNVSGSKVIHSS